MPQQSSPSSRWRSASAPTPAIFSLVRAILLNPLPYADADRVVRLSDAWPHRTGWGPASKQNYLDWLAQNAVFERMAAVSWGAATVSSGPVPVFTEGSRVSPSYFELFGVRALLHEGAALIAVGLAVGFGAARVVTRLLGTFLFVVAPSDPWTLVGAALLAAVGLVACYVPARRAMAVDPLIALKLE